MIPIGYSLAIGLTPDKGPAAAEPGLRPAGMSAQARPAAVSFEMSLPAAIPPIDEKPAREGLGQPGMALGANVWSEKAAGTGNAGGQATAPLVQAKERSLAPSYSGPATSSHVRAIVLAPGAGPAPSPIAGDDTDEGSLPDGEFPAAQIAGKIRAADIAIAGSDSAPDPSRQLGDAVRPAHAPTLDIASGTGFGGAPTDARPAAPNTRLPEGQVPAPRSGEGGGAAQDPVRNAMSTALPDIPVVSIDPDPSDVPDTFAAPVDLEFAATDAGVRPPPVALAVPQPGSRPNAVALASSGGVAAENSLQWHRSDGPATDADPRARHSGQSLTNKPAGVQDDGRAIPGFAPEFAKVSPAASSGQGMRSASGAGAAAGTDASVAGFGPDQRLRQPAIRGGESKEQARDGAAERADNGPSRPKGEMQTQPPSARQAAEHRPGASPGDVGWAQVAAGVAQHAPSRPSDPADATRAPKQPPPESASAGLAPTLPGSAGADWRTEDRRISDGQVAAPEVDTLPGPLRPTDLPASQPSGEAPANARGSAPVPPRLAMQFAQAAQTMLPGQPVEIELNPAELGRVRLVLTESDSGVILSIRAERPDTMDMMRRHVEVLMQDLRQSGYTSLSLDIESRAGRHGETGRHAQDDPAEEPSTVEPRGTQPQRAARALHVGSAGPRTDGRVDIRL